MSIGKAALRFSAGTFFSRVSGMGREIMMAYVLGTSPAAAAFLVAFRFAYLLRRLFGEGAVVNGFVPHYEALRGKDERNASFFFRDLFASLAMLLIGLIGLIELGLFFALKYLPLEANNAEILRLIMLSLPGLLFICLFALHSGFLQCHGHFFLTGAAPIAFNIAWVGTLFFYRHAAAAAIISHLAVALDVAFLLQWAILLPATARKLKGLLNWGSAGSFVLFPPNVRQMLTMLSLSVIGVSAVQVNGFIDVLFARAADLEGPAYLTYAIRLQQFPLALFGIAIASALFPPLARAMEAKEEGKAEELLQFGLIRSSCLMIPCTLGIFLLGAPAINLLFGHGHFTDASTTRTTLCLWGYGLGLLPMTIALLFSQAFCARKDFKTPMYTSLATILLNISFNSLFIYGFGFGATSVAFSTSFTALINALVLYAIYKRRHGINFFTRKWRSLVQLILNTIFAGTAGFMVSRWMGDKSFFAILQQKATLFPHSLSVQALQVAVPSMTFVAVFVLASWLFRFEEVLVFLGSKPK